MPLPGRKVGRLIARGWVGMDQYRDAIVAAREGGDSVASIAKRLNVTPQRIYQVLK